MAQWDEKNKTLGISQKDYRLVLMVLEAARSGLKEDASKKVVDDIIQALGRSTGQTS